MKSDRVQYKVTIFDEQYTLISDEPDLHVMQSVEKVDELIKKIIFKSSVIDVKRAAIFASLQIMSELINLKAKIESDATTQACLLSSIEKAITLLDL